MPLLNTSSVHVGARAATAAYHRATQLLGAVLPVTDGLRGHWDASVLGLADGAKVAELTDQSGLGNHFVQTTEDNKPVYRVGAQNGLSVVEHSTSATLLHHMDVVYPATIAQPNTLLGVFRAQSLPPGGEGGKALLDGAGQSTARNAIFSTGTPRTMKPHAGALLAGAPDSDLLWHLYNAEYNGASSTFRLDKALVASGDAGAQSLDSHRFNANSALSDDVNSSQLGVVVAEMVLYDRLLTTAERDSVESYLHDKWLAA